MNSVAKEKQVPTSSSFKKLEELIKDPLLGPKLAFLKTLATDAETFPKDFQSNWPLTPFLHTSLSVLVDRLMEKVVKSSEIKIITSALTTSYDNRLVRKQKYST